MSKLRPLALSTLAFRHRSAEDAVAAVGAAGFRLVDLAAIPGFCPHLDLDDAESGARMKALVDQHGLRVTSVNAGPWSGLLEPEPQLDAILARTERACDAARLLGARVVTVNTWWPKNDWEADVDDWIALFRRERELGRRAGVDVQVEAPHAHLLAGDVQEAVRVLERLRDDDVRITYDTSHVAAGGWSARDSLRLLGPRIGHVHLRDARGGAYWYLPGEGEYDFGELFHYLDAHGLDCTVALEPEWESEEPDEAEIAARIALASDYLQSL